MGYSVFPLVAVDGELGRATSLALRRFQLSSGIAPNGIQNGQLDEETRVALEIEARNLAMGREGKNSESADPEIDKNYRGDFEKFVQEEIPGFRSDRLLILGQSHERIESPCFGINELPPRELWQNILPIAKAVDKFERNYEKIRINAAYRSPAYNRCIGGPSSSTHTSFMAIDVSPLKPTPENINGLFQGFNSLRENGDFKGGIGKYRLFIHLDGRGVNKTWAWDESAVSFDDG